MVVKHCQVCAKIWVQSPEYPSPYLILKHLRIVLLGQKGVTAPATDSRPHSLGDNTNAKQEQKSNSTITAEQYNQLHMLV